MDKKYKMNIIHTIDGFRNYISFFFYRTFFQKPGKMIRFFKADIDFFDNLIYLVSEKEESS